MNQRPTIREQMDACRPDSDDLLLPEHAADVAELQAAYRESTEVRTQWERSQQDGRIIRSAMQDVSLPAGMEARLLAAVQAAAAVPLAGVKHAVREEAPTTETAPTVAPARPNRRWLLKAAAGIATVAALAVFGFVFSPLFQPTEQPITTDQLAAQAEEWLRAVNPQAMKATKTLPATYPKGIVLGPVDRMGTIVTSQGSVTVYLVKNRTNSGTATLLVFPTTLTYPVGTLPLSNIPGVSGGWQVRAWQRDGVLYVIAVPEKSDARLDQFVPQQPIG